MPVECDIKISAFDQERFHAVDKRVMRHVFDIHNTLGRFCDERVYQDELAYRCSKDGLDVHREARIRVVHEGFAKSYFLDLLVECGSIYELKTAEMLNPSHQGQLINYLLLAGVHHGKLLNFRPGSVESRFVSTRLQREERYGFRMDEHSWLGEDAEDCRLREILIALLEDWGAFLDVNLYRSALLYFTSGADAGMKAVEIRLDDRIIGVQSMCTLSNGAAWHISSVRESLSAYEMHLRRLIHHTALERLCWINLDHQIVTLKTIKT